MFEANFIKSGKLIPRCLDPTETIFPPEMKRVSVLNRSLVTVPESEKKSSRWQEKGATGTRWQ